MKSIQFKLAVAVLASSILLVVSCKKEAASAPPTTQEKVLGKWKIQSVVDNFYYSGSAHILAYPIGATDYADFRNDGKIYFYEFGNYDTTGYGIISDTKLWLDTPADIYDIQALTNSAMKLYQKDISSLPDYIETTSSFSK